MMKKPERYIIKIIEFLNRELPKPKKKIQTNVNADEDKAKSEDIIQQIATFLHDHIKTIKNDIEKQEELFQRKLSINKSAHMHSEASSPVNFYYK
jgi:hypothetical protein